MCVCSLYVQWRFKAGIEKQFLALKKGFSEIIPPQLLKTFDEKELELVISGLGKIDVRDWKMNTRLKNCSLDTLQIKWFWKVCCCVFTSCLVCVCLVCLVCVCYVCVCALCGCALCGCVCVCYVWWKLFVLCSFFFLLFIPLLMCCKGKNVYFLCQLVFCFVFGNVDSQLCQKLYHLCEHRSIWFGPSTNSHTAVNCIV